MQLNPARGRKRDDVHLHGLAPRRGAVYAAQPREGTETDILSTAYQFSGDSRFMQLNPARGRKLSVCLCHQPSPFQSRFMQLNPARGRKRVEELKAQLKEANKVYAAQPREGTETFSVNSYRKCEIRFMQLNPARGRKLLPPIPRAGRHAKGLCSSTPRGDGNPIKLIAHYLQQLMRGLCSSTPRGDGNVG